MRPLTVPSDSLGTAWRTMTSMLVFYRESVKKKMKAHILKKSTFGIVPSTVEDSRRDAVGIDTTGLTI